jgi:hypothetical protein
MTVYRSVDEARIDPAVLSKDTSTLLGMRKWFDDANRVCISEEHSLSFKLGYLMTTLSAIKHHLISKGF